MTYKEFIELMKSRGYIHRNNSSTTIDENDPMVNIFKVGKNTSGKILELTCPENNILSLCGKDMGCENYNCSLKLFDENNKEPFTNTHKGYVLGYDTDELRFNDIKRAKGAIIDIVITKVANNEQRMILSEAYKYTNITNPIMKLINSENHLEYPMLMGIYKVIPKHLVNNSFNLYGKERLIFYVLEPDIDITNVEFKIDLDIFEKINAILIE